MVLSAPTASARYAMSVTNLVARDRWWSYVLHVCRVAATGVCIDISYSSNIMRAASLTQSQQPPDPLAHDAVLGSSTLARTKHNNQKMSDLPSHVGRMCHQEPGPESLYTLCTREQEDCR